MKPSRTGSTTLLAALALGAAASAADPLFESRAPDRPRLVRAGDFNADGVADIAIAHALSNQIAILLGDGAGGFRPADSSPFDAPLRPTGLAVMDLDNDPNGGDDLVVVGNRSGTLIVFTTSVSDPAAPIPQARFVLDASFLLGFGPASVILAQLDPDGEVDAVVSLTGQDELSILAGQPAGNFNVESNTTVTDDTSTRPTAGPDSLAAGDWDGDGDTDLAVANTREGRIALLLGNGNRTFQAPVFLAACSGCAVPRGIALGRIDPDPIDDLVVPFSGGLCSGGGNSGGICLADVDCPGGACVLSERIAIYRGNSTPPGLFDPPQTILLPAGSDPSAVEVADLDGDLVPDLAVAAAGGDSVYAFLNDGMGIFPSAPDFSGPLEVAPLEVGTPISLAAVDAAGNGPPPDLVVAHFGSDNFQVLENLSVPGAADFLPRPPVSTSGSDAPISLVRGPFFATNREDLFGLWFGGGGFLGFLVEGFGAEHMPRRPAFGGRRCSGGTNDGLPCNGDVDCLNGGACLAETTPRFARCAGGTNDGLACAVDPDCPGGVGCVSGAVELGSGAAADFNRDGFADLAIPARETLLGPPGLIVFRRSTGLSSTGSLRVFLEPVQFLAAGAAGEALPRVLVPADLNPLDHDFDSIPDTLDNCPTVFNPVPAGASAQPDADGNGRGDACEDGASPDPCGSTLGADCDGDALPNTADNCPAVFNPGQADSDVDGIGDDCERAGALDLLALGDADADGSGEVRIFPGRGNGTFCSNPPDADCPPTAPYPRAGDPPMDVPTAAAAADFNLLDPDLDGVSDFLDNCPTVPNPSQVLTRGICIVVGIPDPSACCTSPADCSGDPCETAGACSPGSTVPNDPCRASTNQCSVSGFSCTADADCLTGETCLNVDCPGGLCLARFRGDACNDCTADLDADGVVDLLDTCPADPIPIQTDSDLDGRGDVCTMPGADLLVGTGAGGAGTLTLFTGDGKGRLFYPTAVAPPAVPALDSVAFLAAGRLENLPSVVVFAVEDSGAADSLRVLFADSEGRFAQTGALDPADSGVIAPPIPAAEFRALLLIDLNRDGSDDLVLAERSAGVCAAADRNAGARCAADPECDRTTAGDGLGQCVGNGAVVIALGAPAAICLGGANDGQPCLDDSECPGGACGQGGLFLPSGTPVLAGTDPRAIETVQFDDDDADGLPTGNDDIDLAVVHQQGPAGPASGNLLVLQNLIERRSDIDRSGRVDGFDLSRLARGFGITYDRLCTGGGCPFPAEDLNLDGEVDGMDLAILTSRFGRRF